MRSQNKQYNRYILYTYFNNSSGVDYDVIPVVSRSKEYIEDLLTKNSKSSSTFELWNYSFTSSDIINHGVKILTVDEFFAVN